MKGSGSALGYGDSGKKGAQRSFVVSFKDTSEIVYERGKRIGRNRHTVTIDAADNEEPQRNVETHVQIMRRAGLSFWVEPPFELALDTLRKSVLLADLGGGHARTPSEARVHSAIASGESLSAIFLVRLGLSNCE